MDSPDIDALVEEIGDQLLDRLRQAGGDVAKTEIQATWNGPPQALELDLSEAGHSDLETRELALAAAERGLIRMLIDPEEAGTGARQPRDMAEALMALPSQPKPSSGLSADAMTGTRIIQEQIAPYLPNVRRRV